MGKALTSLRAWALLLCCAALMVACFGSETYYAGDCRDLDKEFGMEESADSLDSSVYSNVNRELGGRFNLASNLEPVQLEIFSLTTDLKKLKSVTARIERNRIEFTYKAPTMEFPTGLALLEYTCRFRDVKESEEMKFSAYANLVNTGTVNVVFYHALESDRLKKLVQEKGESFNLARKHVYGAIHELLDPEREFAYEISNTPYGTDTLEALAYQYSLFFNGDSTFYRNFKKLSSAVGGSKRWDDVLPAKKITDELIEYYGLEESRCDTAGSATANMTDLARRLYIAAKMIVGVDALPACKADSIPEGGDKPADTTSRDSVVETTVEDLFGACTINRKWEKVEFAEGEYYECRNMEWVPIVAPAYFGDEGEGGEIVKYGDKYFICNGGFSWSVLTEEEVVPPVEDLRRCVEYQLLPYGDKVYRCDWLRDRWYELPADSVPLYKKNGYFCTDTTDGRIENVEGTYWTCNGQMWRKMYSTDTILYVHRVEHEGECDNGSKGTQIYWKEPLESYIACDAGKREWDLMGVTRDEYYCKGVFDGGVFVDDSTVEKRIGDFVFAFQKIKGYAYRYDMDHVTATVGEKEYGALFRNQQPYLSGKRGENPVAIDGFSGKSASFDGFVARYTHPESPYPAFGAQLTHVGEDSYMDWNKAEGFCPAGYHVPDTSEWSADFLKIFPVDARDNQDSPLKVRYNGTTYLYDIYWTSATKDSETHYCYEIRYEDNNGPLSRVIECPDDLYPGVQTLCFKDRGDE